MRSRILGFFLLSLLIIPNLGCQSWYAVRDTFYYCQPIDEMMVTYHCNRAAKAAWKAREHLHCGRARSDHFGTGFRAGYADVASGGKGCPPPLPPRRYWGWRYQNCEGQECVASWFDGYPAGARAAEEDGVANWSRMQTSYLIDAQYAARMHGNKQSALPPNTLFPGEVLEEVPIPADATPGTTAPESTVTDPAVAPPPVETTSPAQTPPQAPAPESSTPRGESSPKSESEEEVGSMLRRLDSPAAVTAKIGGDKAIVAPEVKTVRRFEAPAEAPVAARKFEMPVVEVLSGVSVPKKQLVSVEAASEIEISDSTPVAEQIDGQEEIAVQEPAKSTAPTLAPVVSPALAPFASRESSVVAETPVYSLGSEGDAQAPAIEKIPASVPVTKRKPPIVPAQSKKSAPPIVRPVERSRMAALDTGSATKQASFTGSDGEEVPVLRRIDISK